MRLTRLHLLLLTVALLSMPLTAQQLVQARVEMDASALGATGAKEVEGLRERIRKFADGFSPDVRLSMTPKEPMQVSLYIRLTSGAGQHFTGDLTLTAYRPIYGSERQTPLCLVMEREVPIQNSEARSFFPLQGSIPESILGRRLYYYLSVAMLLYYDSFDTLGGQPFLDHLLQRSEELGDAWREVGDLRAAPLSPERLLPELRGREGTEVRELFCLYHREVLDEPVESRGRESLMYWLEEMDKLRLSMQIPRLIQMIGETKAGELKQRSNDPEVRALVEELIPWIREQ
ncbi:DUF4835 family protein [uncultured Porphyromonas sp.]|uniref:type IX secretion component PorD family protein n=1 Tax=uncultured Porphyromonas sp. TaxID=159274 RepID=UPI002631F8D1|nr:DUF4835 family protein [uncultured Porphyromonas sp.]